MARSLASVEHGLSQLERTASFCLGFHLKKREAFCEGTGSGLGYTRDQIDAPTFLADIGESPEFINLSLDEHADLVHRRRRG